MVLEKTRNEETRMNAVSELTYLIQFIIIYNFSYIK